MDSSFVSPRAKLNENKKKACLLQAKGKKKSGKNSTGFREQDKFSV